MTTFVITRNTEPIYASTSWPRFKVAFETAQRDHPTDLIDWTTVWIQK